MLYVIEDFGLHERWYGEFDKSHIGRIHEWENEKEGLDQICKKHLEGVSYLDTRHIAIGDPAQETLRLIDEEGVRIFA